ncbi:Uncharacterised protein [Mycobacterium tuberculosis]|jgi:hypothetical protein|nr:Uncharacterised protein [Mycobacterium tuberculosis]
MIQMVDIREWRTRAVLGSGGHKVGTLEPVHVGTSAATAPSWPGQTAAGSSAGGSGCWSARGRVE